MGMGRGLGGTLGLALLAAGAMAAGAARAQDAPPVLAVGQCVDTTIQEIGGRLEGDATFESGVGLLFANGLSQVSYDRVEGVTHAQAGDAVRMCLVSLPEDCPPGDDRGKVYETTDLVTGRSWTMPDSEHMCGGA